MRNRLISGYLTLCLMLAVPAAQASDRLVLAAMIDNPVHLIAARIAEATMKHIGQPARIRFVPAKRALFEADLGKVDGDVGRIANTVADFPNLRASSTPVVTVRGFAFAATKGPVINRWGDLKGHRFAFIRGVRIFEKNTRAFPRQQANSFEELRDLLADGRVDLILATDIVNDAFRLRHPQQPRLHPLGEALITTPLYLHLHKRHEALLPRVERALKTLTLTGEIERLHRAALREINPPGS